MTELYNEKHEIQLMLEILGSTFAIYVAFTIVVIFVFKWKQQKTAARFNTNKLHLQDLNFPDEVYREREGRSQVSN